MCINDIAAQDMAIAVMLLLWATAPAWVGGVGRASGRAAVVRVAHRGRCGGRTIVWFGIAMVPAAHSDFASRHHELMRGLGIRPLLTLVRTCASASRHGRMRAKGSSAGIRAHAECLLQLNTAMSGGRQLSLRHIGVVDDHGITGCGRQRN